MQGAEPILTRRKPPSSGSGSDSSSEEPAPQKAVNNRANPPARSTEQPKESSSLLLSIIIALLISASMFTYFYMNLKQAGIIRDNTQKYRDINAELKVELADVIKGSGVSFDIKRQAVCTKCQGTGARSAEDIVVCHHCKGRGSQIVKQRMGPMTWEVEQRCPYCGGVGKTIKHKCDVCHGKTVLQVENRIDIKLPKGAPEGYTLVVEERGEEAPGYTPGNLNIRITTAENPHFKRMPNNIDLEYHMVLSLLEALVGFERDIELPTGEIHTLKRTTVTQHDEHIVVSGKGVPIHSGSGSGDLIIHVSVSFPDVLSDDDKKREVFPKNFSLRAAQKAVARCQSLFINPPMWDPQHKNDSIQLSGTDVAYMSKESSSELVGTVIGLPAAKKYAKYFEITVEKNRGAVFVGWMDATATLTFPEKDPLLSGIGNSIKSWAMDSYTGSIGHNNKWKKDYGTKLKGGDVIGSGYDPEAGVIFFVVNGVNLGIAFDDVPKGLKLHPAVSMRYNDTRIKANFGAHFKPFKYDLTKLSEQLTHMGRNIQRQSAVAAVLNCEKYAPIALTNSEQLSREREVAALSERANLTQSQFCSLPEEVISTIFSHFKAIDLVQTFRVSRLWHRLASDNKVWRAVLHKQFNIQTIVPEEDEEDSDEEDNKKVSLPLTYTEEHFELKSIFKTRYNWLRGQYVSERSYKVGAGVNCLQFDSRYLVCGIDQEILVYDVNTGELLNPTIFQDSNVLALQFRDDNLVCGSSDGFVKLIDLSCGITKWQKKAHNGQTDTLHYLNDEILTGGWDGHLKVWDLESGKLRNNVPVHSDAVLCARFADVSGSTTVSSGNDKAFVLWSLNSNSIVTKFSAENYAGSVNCIQASPDDHTIVFGDENTVRMFDTRNTSAPWTTLKGPKSAVLSLQYDPKSGKIVTGGTNNRVTVWHEKTGSLYSIKMPGVVKGLQFDDKKLIVGGDYTHRAKQFNFEQGTRVLEEEELYDMRDYWLSRDN